MADESMTQRIPSRQAPTNRGRGQASHGEAFSDRGARRSVAKPEETDMQMAAGMGLSPGPA